MFGFGKVCRCFGRRIEPHIDIETPTGSMAPRKVDCSTIVN